MFEKINKHTTLFKGMSECAGVDLAEKIAKDPSQAQNVRSAIFRCMKCQQSNECYDWQAEKTTTKPEMPSFCLNHQFFESKD